jgi:hypothetical protein
MGALDEGVCDACGSATCSGLSNGKGVRVTLAGIFFGLGTGNMVSEVACAIEVDFRSGFGTNGETDGVAVVGTMCITSCLDIGSIKPDHISAIIAVAVSTRASIAGEKAG